MQRKLISSFAVRELCGGVSNMTIWRWLQDPDMNFPKPIKIGRRNYWREADMIVWLDQQVSAT
nr:AlpA family phage regulatory protein [Loktanella sp. DSM 29012]